MKAVLIKPFKALFHLVRLFMLTFQALVAPLFSLLVLLRVAMTGALVLSVFAPGFSLLPCLFHAPVSSSLCCLLLRLCILVCTGFSLVLLPPQGHPIYPPQKVKFHFGMHKNKADPAAGFQFLHSSPEYAVEHTNDLQSFELPSVLAVGGIMRVPISAGIETTNL